MFYRLPGDVSRFLQPTLLVFAAVLLAAYVQERLARGGFFGPTTCSIKSATPSGASANRPRQRWACSTRPSAASCMIWANPLTSVQTGAQTLRQFARDGIADPPLVDEFAGIIEDGAQMLDYLRLSLIEQSRVLEGKPTPLDLQDTTVRPLVEAGVRYQKPRLAAGREIRIEGDDALQIHADAMKMVTVLMNLIGNALKYSDGPVRVVWRPAGQVLLIGVCDQGMAGGASRARRPRNCSRRSGGWTRTPRSRAQGLGLLSVRKIVEAHGGEAFIAGMRTARPLAVPSPRLLTARTLRCSTRARFGPPSSFPARSLLPAHPEPPVNARPRMGATVRVKAPGAESRAPASLCPLRFPA
jgi:signal transduction histidine kinase